MESMLRDKILDNLSIQAGFFDSYLYFMPMEHILSGFCAEQTRNGIYISKYYYSLFDRASNLNLNLSERLPYPECFIDYNSTKKTDVASVFIERVAPYIEDVRNSSDPLSIYLYIQTNPKLLKNEWIMKTFILIQVFLEKYTDALTNLEEILNNKYTGTRLQITMDCREIFDLLIQDPSSAKERVLEWEEQMKLKILFRQTENRDRFI